MNKPDMREGIDIGFTKELLPECHHLCLIYDDEAQRRKIVSEFMSAGIKQGDLVRYFADTSSPDEIRTWLTEIGVDISQAEQLGKFAIIRAESAYCPSGQFVPTEVIDNARSRYAFAKQSGFSGSRVSSEMSWIFQGIPGSDHFIEYEVRLNMINETFPYIGMCQYDARRFDGATIYKILQVHPYMVARGQIVRNPYYKKPDEFQIEFL